MRSRRPLLLRIANVNPDSVNTHSDRVLYRTIGVFILLYFGYATAGGAAFVDASVDYSHPWWQWLVGPLVATGVVAYDRAVVGRVGVSFDNLGSTDPADLLKRPTFGLYAGRIALALLFALMITEPLMLTRYRGEIDARLNEVHNAQISASEGTGAVATYQARLAELKQLSVGEDEAVAALNASAAQKRRDARALYQQALADSAGDGVSRKAGCPAGGYCDSLVQRSRALDDEAAALDVQAAQLQQSQQTARAARDAEITDLTAKISEQRTANAAAIRADSGFGARTTAMWHLISSDFWGIGVFYIGIALLLVALDCAAVGLKFVSRGNAYERNEARIARQREHQAVIAYRRGVDDARTYGEASARILAGGLDRAAQDEQLTQAAADRARALLYAALQTQLADPTDETTDETTPETTPAAKTPGDQPTAGDPHDAAINPRSPQHRRPTGGPANRRDRHHSAGATRT
ncbi:DUF4407 domain-containing protein [Mangrovihabitans endophyticus]|uniref:DUF4407 domain-containing protein n=1 Tax=Mangrovihabitans endophyticus TaxID=1751298 RepID=A0A8J3FQY6_9ACTN|nr:DUF4407 domain-containing protein [Mangrovihabitans endophyticus]GGL04780.1 hypothetical protein GCM10012284_44180 [Mangrovihabitans endophyticus]